MESPSHLLPVPRLRLSRHNLDNQNAHPITHAGPSRLSDTPLNTNLNIASYDDEDQVATPRVSASNTLPSSSPVETPAARLRALLSRAQNTPNTRTPMPHTPAPVSPSVLESDFDPPDFGPGTPSIARDSLKGIFSRALRDPGDTPQKGRKRSNSVDVSEVEASPRVEKERSINKGKRRSMSDEEVETTSSPFASILSSHPSGLIDINIPPIESQRSESSFRSNAFHNLRERLTNTQTQLKDELHPSTTHERMECIIFSLWSQSMFVRCRYYRRRQPRHCHTSPRPKLFTGSATCRDEHATTIASNVYEFTIPVPIQCA